MTEQTVEQPTGQYYFGVKGGEFVYEGKMVNEFTAWARGSERYPIFHRIISHAAPVIAGIGTVGMVIARIIEGR